jgi:hypothetical protein
MTTVGVSGMGRDQLIALLHATADERDAMRKALQDTLSVIAKEAETPHARHGDLDRRIKDIEQLARVALWL